MRTVRKPVRQSVRRISPRLKDNPRAKLDPARELASYLSALKRYRGKAAERLIRDFATRIGLRRSTRTVTAIPAHVEEPCLLRALQTYVRTGDDLRGHHIVVFLNSSQELSARRHSELVALQTEKIRRFRSAHPELEVSVISHRFRKARMGEIRGLMTDAIACAAQRAGRPGLIIISNDADQVLLSRGYLSSIRRLFSGPGVPDAGHGGGTWGTRRMQRELPELWVNMEIRAALLRLREDRSGKIPNRVTFWGINSFFRLAIYCAAGGYDYRMLDTEDVDLGCAIETARTTQSSWFHGFFGVAVVQHAEAFVVSDPRRIVRGILRDQVTAKSSIWLDRVPAARIPLELLASRYREQKKFLQPRDFAQAARGKPGARRKVHLRIRKIFLDSVRLAPLFNPEQLPALARRIGIKVTRPVWKPSPGRFPELLSADLNVDRLVARYGGKTTPA